MTYTTRTNRIKIAREVEAMAIDAKDYMVLHAAQRCIQAYGWMKKPTRRDWLLVSEFANGLCDLD